MLPSISRLPPPFWYHAFLLSLILGHKYLSLPFSNFPAPSPSFLTSPYGIALILSLLKTWVLLSPFTESALTDELLTAKTDGLSCFNYSAATGFGNYPFLSEIALLVLLKLFS